jgi:2-polyprenyl-3-methyl-5-hydroxy-6-metoxy-1,4-benzoquinol methylase
VVALVRTFSELVSALHDGWLTGTGRAVDVGCGLGSEAGYLASLGWQVAGIDLSGTALAGRGRSMEMPRSAGRM